MSKSTINISAIAMAGLLAAGCGGGTTEPLPAEGEVSTAVDATATEAATAVEDVAAESSEALEQAGDTVTQVADSATDSMSEGWQDMQSNWQDSIGSIKDRWADLTEEDLLVVNGDRDQLVSLVQDKYGLDRETAESEVADWASSL